jgi:hypothetical protein
MKARGRPRVSAVPRDEQLRRAKRAQRARQRAAGIVTAQLVLPETIAEKLRVASRSAEFLPALDALLDRLLVRVTDYPQLRDLAWNRAHGLIGAREAFQLYERNWRFVDVDRLDAGERALLERLTAEFGNGVING